MTETPPPLQQLHADALAADTETAWMQFYQTLAGTSLIVPLTEGAGETAKPQLVDHDGLTAVQAYAGMDLFASAVRVPTDYAELDGAQLCGLLEGQATPLLVQVEGAGMPLLIDTKAQEWISSTFGAEVTRRATEGVSVAAPELPDLTLMQALGQAVGALGADCPEAWLVTLSGAEVEPELVLVLGLSDQAARMEAEIAETVTRSIQAVTEQRFAVACPDRGSALMASARKHGIGIGGDG
jgi:hypothetical protein